MVKIFQNTAPGLNGIALGYWLDDGGGIRVPAEAGNFSLHHSIQTSFGAQPAFYPVDTRVNFPI
jgi:hypothetical protein